MGTPFKLIPNGFRRDAPKLRYDIAVECASCGRRLKHEVVDVVDSPRRTEWSILFWRKGHDNCKPHIMVAIARQILGSHGPTEFGIAELARRSYTLRSMTYLIKCECDRVSHANIDHDEEDDKRGRDTYVASTTFVCGNGVGHEKCSVSVIRETTDKPTMVDA